MGSLETRNETWRELIAIGLVARDLSPETIARCAQVSRVEVMEAFELARSKGVMDADHSVAPDHAARLVDELPLDIASGVHASMTRHLLSGGPELLPRAMVHARQVTTRHDTEAVITLCDHFGDVNLSLGAYGVARRLLELAMELDLSVDERRQGWRLVMLARAIDGEGDVVGARSLLKQAMLKGERARDASLIVAAACQHVLPADWYAGDPEALGLLQRAASLELERDEQVRLLAARGLAEMRVPQFGEHGQHTAWITRPEVAQPLTRKALDESAGLVPDTRALALLAWRSTHRGPEHLPERHRVSQELVQLSNLLRRADLQAEGGLYLAVDALEAGNRPDYDRAVGVVRWVATTDGNPRLLWRADTLAAGAAFLGDELDEADALVARAETTGRLTGSPRLANTRVFFLAQRAVSRQDPRSLLELAADDTSPLVQSPLTCAVAAWSCACAGDVRRAEWLASRSLRRVDLEASGMFLLTRLSEAALAMGSTGLCRDLIERLTPWRDHISVDSNAWWCDGPVSLWLAMLHHQVGNADEVGDLLDHAGRAVDALGDARSRRRLHMLERRVGLSGPRVTEHDLTARELEVLQHLGSGATNTEIARQLGYSVSTIRHATMGVYRKLGVAGRAEAVARAYALRLITPTKGS